MTMEERITEITPHGGEAMIHTLISKTAIVNMGSRIEDHAEVHDKACVTGCSVVKGFAKIMEEASIIDSSILEHARVSGRVRVEKSVMEGTSWVLGNAVVVYNSIVNGNAIIAGNSQVANSQIGCNARVLDQARLYNVYFRSQSNGDINNTITIEGDAVLDFAVPMELYPNTRVHEGYWTRPPLVLNTPVFPMVEGVGDRVQIGCRNRTVEFWKRRGMKTLLSYGLEANLYNEFYEALEKMEQFKLEYGSPENPRRTDDDRKEF